MHFRVFSIFLVFSLMSALAAQTPAAGQPSAGTAVANASTPAKDDVPSGGKLVIPSDEVSVIFTVTDKHGKFVKDLKQNQFKILDNNLPPRQITNFDSQTDLPLRVGLLIDASNS